MTQDREHVRPIEGLAAHLNQIRPMPDLVPLGLRAGSHGHLLVMSLEPNQLRLPELERGYRDYRHDDFLMRRAIRFHNFYCSPYFLIDSKISDMRLLIGWLVKLSPSQSAPVFLES